MTLHHHYTQHGYTFRIDRIHNGEVYVAVEITRSP
jgi:hypothetical protein